MPNLPLDFYQAINDVYLVNTANNTGHIKCSAESFENMDPFDSDHQSQCFCDEEYKVLDEDDV